jgi:hypothetical protein
MDLSSINLWNPGAGGPGVGVVLLTAFLLGLLHGITPDEHTWPITFSYAVGSYSAKGGMLAGFLFSLTFTLQRGMASELAYFATLNFANHPVWNFYIYALVGTIMLGSGLYILHRGHAPHLFHQKRVVADFHEIPNPRSMPKYMPLVHGFVAGWGMGAFAVILYTVLVPAMTSPYLAFLPGIAFGLGTMSMQVLLGSLIGKWMSSRHLNDQARQYVARMVAGRTLQGGGIAFVLAGLLGIRYPAIGDWHIETGLHVHNLDQIDLGFFLVVVVIFSIAAYAFVRSMREARNRFR